MSANLTIEQIILNHNISVNISDAGSLSGHLIEDFSLVGHTHSASDITRGTMDPERLPMATDTSAGIVGLSNATNSESKTLAVTPYALNAVRNLVLDSAKSKHTHSPEDITTGTFSSLIAAQSNASYTTRQIRNIYLSSSKPTSTNGQDGDVWMQYE